MQTSTRKVIMRIVDVGMTVLLLCLMAYQVTGEELHEWIGIAMTLLVISHQCLNRRWYAALFKGKFCAYRIASTAVNILLLGSFVATAFCGMAMSGFAVPFLYGVIKTSVARRLHLALSHWTFVLMGLHLGLHLRAMTAGFHLAYKVHIFGVCVFACISAFGLYRFIMYGALNYMFFQVPFAFLDYEKSAAQIFFENISMLLFWAFIGYCCSLHGRKRHHIMANSRKQ